MNARVTITLDAETLRRARTKAATLGLSFSAYVRNLITKDLGPSPKSRSAGTPRRANRRR
jgi:predicted DNA binding CopG/RHH family protein